MTDRRQFIDLELAPLCGDHADDFDLEAVFDEVTEYDPAEGFRFVQAIRDEHELHGYSETLNAALERHDASGGRTMADIDAMS